MLILINGMLNLELTLTLININFNEHEFNKENKWNEMNKKF